MTVVVKWLPRVMVNLQPQKSVLDDENWMAVVLKEMDHDCVVK